MSQQRDYTAPSDFYRRGLDPANKGYDYKEPKEIEVTNVDESEKKCGIRSIDRQNRDYPGMSSYTLDPRAREDPPMYQSSNNPGSNHNLPSFNHPPNNENQWQADYMN